MLSPVCAERGLELGRACLAWNRDAMVYSVVTILRVKNFSQTTACVGIAPHGLDLAHFIIGMILPGTGVILIAIAGPLYLVWPPSVGLGLSNSGALQIPTAGIVQQSRQLARGAQEFLFPPQQLF